MTKNSFYIDGNLSLGKERDSTASLEVPDSEYELDVCEYQQGWYHDYCKSDKPIKEVETYVQGFSSPHKLNIGQDV